VHWTRPEDWKALLFVHAVAVAGCLYAGWFVLKNATATLPICDEWYLLADWQQSESTGPWLLKHHFDHRYPFGKAAWLGLLKIGRYDFRLPMIATVGLLTATAILGLWCLRNLRGWSHPVDAIVPALLFHLGHHFNLLMGYQVTFALFAYAVVGWLWCVLNWERVGKKRWLVGAMSYAVIALGSGGFGLVWAVPFALWCGWVAWRHRGFARGCSSLSAIIAVAYSAWVFSTRLLVGEEGTAPDRSISALCQGTLSYLATGFGDWHIASPWQTWVVLGLTVILYLVAFIAVCRTNVPGRWALLAILFLLIGLGFATSWIRGVGFGSRFVTPSAIGLMSCFIAIIRGFPGLAERLWLPVLALGTAMVWLNHEPAKRYGYQLRTAAAEFRRDVDAGLEPLFLQGKYEGTMLVVIGGLAESLDVLRGVPELPFRNVAVDRPHRFASIEGPSFPLHYRCGADQLANPPVIRLPDPPEDAIGVLLIVSTVDAPGWQRMVLNGNDRTTGERHSVETFTPWLPKRKMALAIPLRTRSTEIELRPVSHIEGIDVESGSWILRDASLRSK